MALARSIKVYQHLIQERPYLVQAVQTGNSYNLYFITCS